ncbi:hypothetical protein SprV_0501997700 [Sparganum proliferum]
MILPRLQTFALSLICLGLAVACCGFHSSGILLNPQDIAPLHGGKVFGIMSTIGTIPGFTGVYLTGYILQHWRSWSAVFHFAVLDRGISHVGRARAGNNASDNEPICRAIVTPASNTDDEITAINDSDADW